MPGLASFGGRCRLVAVSCVVCAAVVASWHVRARRRAHHVLPRARPYEGVLGATSRASDKDSDAPEQLAAEFKVRCLSGACNWLRELTHCRVQEAARRASQPNMLCSDDKRLQLYALYKQATVGACASPPPSRLDFVAHAKWCESQSAVGPYHPEQC